MKLVTFCVLLKNQCLLLSPFHYNKDWNRVELPDCRLHLGCYYPLSIITRIETLIRRLCNFSSSCYYPLSIITRIETDVIDKSPVLNQRLLSPFHYNKDWNHNYQISDIPIYNGYYPLSIITRIETKNTQREYWENRTAIIPFPL